MAQQIEVLVKVLGENENAYKIETQDGETMWLSKRVVSNHGDTKVGFYITMTVFAYIAERSRLI
jgi:hypothetical protein